MKGEFNQLSTFGKNRNKNKKPKQDQKTKKKKKTTRLTL